MRDWIQKRVAVSLNGFMSKNVDRVISGYQPAFDCWLLPDPSCRHSQWDHGDVTSRALVAWRYARLMTGETVIGLEIEQGLKQHLYSVLHPKTGLAFVPEHSDLASDQFYYHMWDQGRVLDYFARQLKALPADDPQRTDLLKRARLLQQGLQNLACSTTLPSGEKSLHWASDVFWNTDPQLPTSRDFGDQNWTGWCIVTSQLLGPQAMLASVTGDLADLELAIQIANGFLAGLEHRRGSRSPMFSAKGAFQGHFHSAVSGLVGLVQLARQLWGSSRENQAREWIELARQAYAWIYDFDQNANPACSCGYFPETSRDTIHSNSELCGAADMMELAAELALCAEMDSAWRSWVDLWDDLERICLNEIRLNQLTNPQLLMDQIDFEDSDKRAHAMKQLQRQQGTWIACRNYICDLATYDGATFLDADIPAQQKSGQAEEAKISSGGCCAYSGVRAYWTAWSYGVTTIGHKTEVRIATSYKHGEIQLDLIEEGLLRVRADHTHHFKMRIPTHIEPSSLRVTGLPKHISWNKDEHWLEIKLPEKADIQIHWILTQWESLECTGPLQKKHLLPNVPTGTRPTYTLKYHGNRLIDIQPEGIQFPYLKGI